MEALGSKIKEGADALGDSIIGTIGSALDKTQAAAMSKGGELMGGLSSSASNAIGSAKRGLSDTISPNALGKAKSDPSPSVEMSPSQAPEKAPQQSYSDIMQSAGISKEAFGGFEVEATDLGCGASHDGCAPQGTARVNTQSLVR